MWVCIIDSDKNMSIDHREFLTGLEIMQRGSPDEKAAFIFQMFDMDGTSMLYREELRAMLNSLVFASSEILEHSNVEAVDDVEELNEGTIIAVRFNISSVCVFFQKKCPACSWRCLITLVASNTKWIVSNFGSSSHHLPYMCHSSFLCDPHTIFLPDYHIVHSFPVCVPPLE
jgi:hypothetical protein